MEPYIYKRTKEGVHYLDLAKTWEKAMVASRIIGAVQEKNPKDVLVSIINQTESILACGEYVALFGTGDSFKKTRPCIREYSIRYSCFFYHTIRLFQVANMPREPCSSSPLTPSAITSVESGSQEH